jgi:hypothetical protein
MPRCPHAKWGPGSGTTCERPQNSSAAKELEERLQKMREDRSKVDSIWLDEPKQQIQTNKISNQNQNQK